MILFKSCPRCSGDRTAEQDVYGTYIICLACGHVTYPEGREEPPQILKPFGRPDSRPA